MLKCISMLVLFACLACSSPALAAGHQAPNVFISEDHRVECVFGAAIHNDLGGRPPDVLCISQATRREEPEITEECGSQMSGLVLYPKGHARYTEVCNMLYGPGSHPFVLRSKRKIRSGPFECYAHDRSAISCWSRDHYSFVLNYGFAFFRTSRG
jgi:hypothetical protein